MTRRVISHSAWRKLLVVLVGIVGFVLVFEVTMFDSREASPQGAVEPAPPAGGARLQFSATAYCKGTTTASGVAVRAGIAASDPAVLPVGSVVSITTNTAEYNGVYAIMDTGPSVRGRTLDLYMWSCHEALAFGRQQIQVTVLRLGWNPRASSPSLKDRTFERLDPSRDGSPPSDPPTPVTVTAPPGP